jgi:hypothetical protein
MPWPAPGPVVHRVAPQPSGFGAPPSGIEHRQSGVIGEHLGRGQHGAQHQLVQRSEPPAGAPHPIAQRGTIQRHALAREDLRLAIQRQMIGVFVDQHMRQQRLARHAAVDRSFRCRCLHDRLFTGPAAIARAADHSHPQLGGHIVQHLRLVFADQMQRTAAAGTGLVLDIDHQLDPWQMRRQCAAIAFGRLGARWTRWCFGCGRLRRRRERVQCRGLLRQRLFQLLDPLLERRVVELLGAAAEPVALQAGDHQPQPLDLGQRRAQDLLQRGRVVGQGCGSGEHAPRLLRRYESAPMNPA